jgi:hypothetical protein
MNFHFVEFGFLGYQNPMFMGARGNVCDDCVVRGLLVTAGTQCIMSFLCRFLGLKLVAIVDCRCDPSRKAVETV